MATLEPFALLQPDMSRNGNFWSGVGVGVGVGAGLILLPQLLGRSGASQIVRLEKSVQIGRSPEEVFNSWVDWGRLPRVSENVIDIRYSGDRSHWRVAVAGQLIEWDAITEQWIPNQAIGWKSVNGPKHTGRVTFSPLGEDTLVHVTMNYAPPSRLLRPFVATLTGHMEGLIEKVLRDFKASVESRPKGIYRTGNPAGPGTSMTDLPKTGTFGGESRKSELGFSGSGNPVTTPPPVKR
jgi:uncharacterized membrane protein